MKAEFYRDCYPILGEHDLSPLSLTMQVTEGAAEEEEVRFLMGAFLSSFLH